MKRWLALLPLVAAGCGFDLPDGKLRCTAAQACPPGYACGYDGLCYHDGRTPAPNQIAAGASCARDADCATDHCADGVCCDAACDGPCETCIAAGAVGTCVPSPAGNPSPAGHPDCEIDPPDALCGQTGMCDGARACALQDGGCDVCTDGVEQHAACNGHGSCAAPTPIDCTPFGCDADGKRCATACADDDGCTAPATCRSNHTCGTSDDGHTCSGGTECTSGNCVDGVCCDTPACTDCSACNLAGHEGTCSPVPLGEDPRAFCAGDAECGTTCDGAGACQIVAYCDVLCLTTQVPLVGLASVSQLSPHACDPMQHTCDPDPLASIPCPGNLECASATTCLTSCTHDADCIDSTHTDAMYCNAGACVATLADGSPCTRNAQCANYLCSKSGPTMNTCVSCLADSDCFQGRICNASHICAFASCAVNPCPTDETCNGAKQCVASGPGGCFATANPDWDAGAGRCDCHAHTCKALQTCDDTALDCRLPAGSPCQTSTDCVTGTACDAMTRTCK
jgi:hypothetical protein